MGGMEIQDDGDFTKSHGIVSQEDGPINMVDWIWQEIGDDVEYPLEIKASRIKQAMDEYKALDYEDMVRSNFLVRNG